MIAHPCQTIMSAEGLIRLCTQPQEIFIPAIKVSGQDRRLNYFLPPRSVSAGSQAAVDGNADVRTPVESAIGACKIKQEQISL